MRKNIFAAVAAVFILAVSFPSFAADSTEAEPYEEGEFPEWAMNLRHAEIITFGSMPFVTIGVTMGYGAYLYFTDQISSFPNPLNKTSSSFTSDQTLQIFGISFGISAILGVTDFTINFLKKSGSDRKAQLLQSADEKPAVVPLTLEEAKELLESSQEKDEASSNDTYISAGETDDEDGNTDTTSTSDTDEKSSEEQVAE